MATATPRCVTIRVENGLARGFEGAATLPLAACPGVRVENGEVVWRRVDDRQDVRMTFEVPPGQTLSVTARCASNPAARRTVNYLLKALSEPLNPYFGKYFLASLYTETGSYGYATSRGVG